MKSRVYYQNKSNLNTDPVEEKKFENCCLKNDKQERKDGQKKEVDHSLEPFSCGIKTSTSSSFEKSTAGTTSTF
jgi:hypothetical protein